MPLKNECLMQIAKAIMNSNSTSETEAGLPGGNFKSGFSLYSTDTEEQVASVNRGLERCAALLKSLLTPDKDCDEPEPSQQMDTQGGQKHKDKAKENYPPNTLSRKLTMFVPTGSSEKHVPVSQPSVKDGGKHTHPHTSSTPITQRDPSQLRVTRELPKALNELPTQTADTRPPTKGQQSGHTDERVQLPHSGQGPRSNDNKHDGADKAVTFDPRGDVASNRRVKKAHRRIEPRKPFVVSKNPPKDKPQVQVKARSSLNSRHQTTTNTTCTQKQATSTTSTRRKPNLIVSTQKDTTITSLPSTSHKKPVPTPAIRYPLLHFPTPVPYLPCLPYPPSSSMPHPQLTETSNRGMTPPWVPCVPLLNGWSPQVSAEISAAKMATSTPVVSNAPIMFVQMPIQQAVIADTEPQNQIATTVTTMSTAVAPSHSASSVHQTPSYLSISGQPVVMTTAVSSTAKPPPVREELKHCQSAPLERSPNKSGGHLSGPWKEVEKNVMLEIANIEQALCERGHSQLVPLLVPLRSCLSEQCIQTQQQLSLPSLSTSHWLEQIQQLEQEKSQLLQRVIESESAYSEAMGELEQANKERSTIYNQVESHRKELEILREDLHLAKEALTSMDLQQTTIKEEYAEAIKSAKVQSGQLETENKELRKKIAHLETELSNSKKESEGFPARVSELQHSIERAQEELAMIRVTITEKDTQLLHMQDQLLGLRQCLAHVLAGLKPVDIGRSCDSIRLSRDSGYKLSTKMVDKLQSLVNDGNVDKFLLETSRTSTSEKIDNSVTSSSDTNSTLTGAELDETLTEPHTEEAPQTSGVIPTQDPASLISSVSNQVITPLNLTNEHSHSPSSQSIAEQSKMALSHLPSPHSTLKKNLATPDPYAKGTSPLSSVDSRTFDGQSCLTTSSEVEFIKDLANLDADIARLQIQFRVALQTSS